MRPFSILSRSVTQHPTPVGFPVRSVLFSKSVAQHPPHFGSPNSVLYIFFFSVSSVFVMPSRRVSISPVLSSPLLPLLGPQIPQPLPTSWEMIECSTKSLGSNELNRDTNLFSNASHYMIVCFTLSSVLYSSPGTPQCKHTGNGALAILWRNELKHPRPMNNWVVCNISPCVLVTHSLTFSI